MLSSFVIKMSIVTRKICFQLEQLHTSAGGLHHANTPVQFTPLYTPLLYSKTGVYRGIHYFRIFALKHRLWVLVRTASVLMCTHNLCFRAKIRKLSIFYIKNFIFTAMKNHCILHGHVFIMKCCILKLEAAYFLGSEKTKALIMIRLPGCTG